MDYYFWEAAKIEPNMNATDWRTQLQSDSRQRIVNKITETLKICFIISGPEGLVELNKLAVRFEEKIFTIATSQSDYLRKISLKMLTMEKNAQTYYGVATSQLNTGGDSHNPQDPASGSVQSEVRNPGQSQIPLDDHSQARQQLLSKNIQNNTANSGIQGPVALSPTSPSGANLTQSSPLIRELGRLHL